MAAMWPPATERYPHCSEAATPGSWLSVTVPAVQPATEQTVVEPSEVATTAVRQPLPPGTDPAATLWRALRSAVSAGSADAEGSPARTARATRSMAPDARGRSFIVAPSLPIFWPA